VRSEERRRWSEYHDSLEGSHVSAKTNLRADDGADGKKFVSWLQRGGGDHLRMPTTKRQLGSKEVM
jgi:hypothetical protein